MDLRKWKPWYARILERCDFSEEEDQRSTDLLSRLLRANEIYVNLDEWRKRMARKNVLVCGAGPSLERDLRQIAEHNLHKRCVLVVADGATTALLEKGMTPDFILTDLDGRIEDLLRAQAKGAHILVHAHGDNMDAVARFVSLFQSDVIGTTEAKPRPFVYNFGGFTDGDRCAFFAEEFRAQRIILVGMDLGRTIGSYSKSSKVLSFHALALKRKKLRIARELLGWLASWSRAELVNATTSHHRIPGIAKTSIDMMARMPEKIARPRI